ncbi:MAG: hypothetical protein P8179_01625 [Candidatus Thiodiazotropha sp.]
MGESRYSANGTLVAAHGGVATPWNSGLLCVVARLGKGEAIPGGTRLAANRLASRYHRQFV